MCPHEHDRQLKAEGMMALPQMENTSKVDEFISWFWYHSVQQSQAHILMLQVLLLFARCTVLQVKIIYILCVFNIIINTSFLLLALDLGKWHRIICTLSVNVEIHIVSMKRMSRLMKFYILLYSNVALCQKYFVYYSER